MKVNNPTIQGAFYGFSFLLFGYAAFRIIISLFATHPIYGIGAIAFLGAATTTLIAI